MDDLTKKQGEVLKFVKEFMVSHGYPPTVREIGEALGLSSPATTHSHLKGLEEKGYIRKNGSKNRAIELLVDNEYAKKNEEIVEVPLLGKITAGNPIEAIENPGEYFSLPAYLIPKQKEVFTLKVSGESMINAGIMDGDKVVIHKQDTAENGQIVAALIDDSATIKRFYKENGHYRLQPENPTMEPIIVDHVTIIGKVVGLIRNM